MEEGLIIHSDGGSRGNPGPSACAFVIENDGKEIYKASRSLGVTTNNVAEYSGVLFALNHVVFHQMQRLGRGQIFFYSDSELMVNQLSGKYKIKNDNLKRIAAEIWKVINKNHLQIKFIHVLRGKNKTADSLVNEELDKSS